MTDMQPQNIESRGGQELQQPVGVPSNERVPVLPSPEGGIETGADRREQTAEAQAAAADAAATGVPVQQPAATTPVDEPSAQPVGDGPAVAGDEDVIEKEWVDKAKQIIETTKNDPHERTERVNQLQKDYLKKRYGKELGASG
jgi:hypothetical protein